MTVQSFLILLIRLGIKSVGVQDGDLIIVADKARIFEWAHKAQHVPTTWQKPI